jgi:hypothetical protein
MFSLKYSFSLDKGIFIKENPEVMIWMKIRAIQR